MFHLTNIQKKKQSIYHSGIDRDGRRINMRNNE